MPKKSEVGLRIRATYSPLGSLRPRGAQVSFTAENLGGAAAICPVCSLLVNGEHIDEKPLDSLRGGESRNEFFDTELPESVFVSAETIFSVRVRYVTQEGLLVEDESVCSADCRFPSEESLHKRHDLHLLSTRAAQETGQWSIHPPFSYVGKTLLASGVIQLRSRQSSPEAGIRRQNPAATPETTP